MFQRTFVAAAGLFVVSVSTALAQAYPSKPIRLMIGYAPGGSAEAGARAAAGAAARLRIPAR
jgi:tripartite-type tricarboxylate transporter receptor subunit TctC